MPSQSESGISSTTVLADPEFRYYPLWDVRGNEVFCYICEPFWNVGDGVAHPENDLTQAFKDPKRVLALDLETLRHAVSQAEEVAAGYGVFNVMIPIHFSTLTDEETRSAYVEACNSSVWPVIDYLNFEVVGLPSIIKSVELTEVIHQIQSFGNNIMVRVGSNFDQFSEALIEDLDALGLDLRGDGRPEDEIMESLKDFSSRAGELGLSKYVHGIETPSLSLSAVASGFDFVGSDAIAEPLEEWSPDGDTVAPVDLLKTLLDSKSS